MLHEVIQQQHLDMISKPSKRDQKNKVKEKTMAMTISHSDEGLSRKTGRPRFGSFIVGIKLRESKWFTHEESSIFCAVVETGFLVERQHADIAGTDEGTGQAHWGVVVWKSGYEKSKNPDYLKIHTLRSKSNKLKVCTESLKDFWPDGTKVRINNQADQHKTVNSEAEIRQQTDLGQKKKEKWHNTEHYAFWCRYEKPEKISKLKQMNDSMKWGSVGLNVGLLMLNRRQRFNTASN